MGLKSTVLHPASRDPANPRAPHAHSWAHSVRVILFPLLPPFILIPVWIGSSPPGIGHLHRIHTACLAAALIAFCFRPLSRKGPGARGAILLGFWLLFLGWAWCGLGFSAAPESTYVFCVVLVDAALLFYAAAQSARLFPRAALVCLVFFHLAALAFSHRVTGQNLFQPEWSFGTAQVPMVFGLCAAGLLVWVLSWGRTAGPARWWVSLLLVVGALGAFWFLRLDASLAERTGAAVPASLVSRNEALAIARREFRAHPVAGVGLGALDRRLRGFGIEELGERAIRDLDPDRLPNAVLAAKIKASAPPPRTSDPDYAMESIPDDLRSKTFWLLRNAGLLPDKWTPAFPHAFHVYITELGSLGVSAGLVLFLFTLASSAHAAATARKSPLTLLLAGLLAIWISLLAEGGMGLALYHPHGILLFACLGGLVWGTAGCLLDESAWENSGGGVGFERLSAGGRRVPFSVPHQEPHVRRGRLVSVLVAVAIAALAVLPTALPLRGARVAGRIPSQALGREETTELLNRAVRFHPLSADIAYLRVEHFLALYKGDLEKGPLSEVRSADLVYDIERAFHLARKRDPYREEIYAAQADFHMGRKQTVKMFEALAEGRRRCPRSLLLALWAVQYARTARDAVRLELALHDALRLTGPHHREIRPYLLRNLTDLYEQKGETARALEYAALHFQSRPGAPVALDSLARLSKRAGWRDEQPQP